MTNGTPGPSTTRLQPAHAGRDRSRRRRPARRRPVGPPRCSCTPLGRAAAWRRSAPAARCGTREPSKACWRSAPPFSSSPRWRGWCAHARRTRSLGRSRRRRCATRRRGSRCAAGGRSDAGRPPRRTTSGGCPTLVLPGMTAVAVGFLLVGIALLRSGRCPAGAACCWSPARSRCWRRTSRPRRCCSCCPSGWPGSRGLCVRARGRSDLTGAVSHGLSGATMDEHLLPARRPPR